MGEIVKNFKAQGRKATHHSYIDLTSHNNSFTTRTHPIVFYHSLLMYHVHYVNHAPSRYQLCCPIHMCALNARLSYPHKCFHVYHNLLFLKNITPLFFLPFSPPFAFLHFLYCNIYFYDNSKSNKNRTLPDWLGGILSYL